MDTPMPEWRKSSYSGGDNGDCVELIPTAVRDSKNPDGPQLRLSMATFVRVVKTDQITR